MGSESEVTRGGPGGSHLMSCWLHMESSVSVKVL